MCCIISQYSTYTLLQNDNFIRITFVGRLLPGRWQCSHAHKSNTVTAKDDVKQRFSCCDVIWTLIFRFLLSSNFWEFLIPHSHSKKHWWCAEVVFTLSEKEKKTGYSCTRIYFNIYLYIAYLIWFMASYTMRRTCIPRNVRRNTKLRDVRPSPEFLRGTRTFVYQSICVFLSSPEYLRQGKISVCKVLVLIKVVPVKNDYFLHPIFEFHRYHQTNGFLYWRSFYWRKHSFQSRAHCPANTNLNLIRSTYSKSNLATDSPAILLLLILSG